MLQPAKTFILKYDYSRYFDTIDHSYLNKLIQRQSFVMTAAERCSETVVCYDSG
jgi:hypothetical protein